jgi:hypothetical protein
MSRIRQPAWSTGNPSKLPEMSMLTLFDTDCDAKIGFSSRATLPTRQAAADDCKSSLSL